MPSTTIRPAPPRKRPGWSLLVGAVLATAALGFAAEMTRDDRAALAREQEDDDAVRADLMALGWAPRPSEGAAVLSRDWGVELLEAERPFLLNLPNGPVSGDPPDAETADRAATIIREELTRFPEGFPERAGLWRVVLCEQLREDGKVIPSLPNYRHTLLLDVDADPEYLRRLIHHEVFHFVDYADDGVVLNDRRWEALNDIGFAYGRGGRDMRGPEVTPMREDIAGFPSLYATSALEEDKAEVFAFMMVRPRAMRRLASDDTVIAAKMHYVMTVVATLAPDLDESFWRRQLTRP